ncbi:unnamed protein product [Pleuronectes platessa]|uniref:Uncharacterized protein n=1 Tax=Pleuronectes platessa TaxID=8262 RepID=A0A9N7UNM5_PLEPL|nr:unnamed protein product [Pleuronectes platessa]
MHRAAPEKSPFLKSQKWHKAQTHRPPAAVEQLHMVPLPSSVLRSLSAPRRRDGAAWVPRVRGSGGGSQATQSGSSGSAAGTHNAHWRCATVRV